MTTAASARDASAGGPRILWANTYCLLDVSSGASISVREMLRQLQARGWRVDILGATIFDAHNGSCRLRDRWAELEANAGRFVRVADGSLSHELLVTGSTERALMTTREQSGWFARYLRLLHETRPRIVFYYGGQPFDFLIADAAREHGAEVVSYVANGNYHGGRWCRDVDLVLTDSLATAGLLRRRASIEPVAVGKFIDPLQCVPPSHRRETVLFVNPRLEKGAAIVAMLAALLETKRPDIRFDVVESRGSWQEVVRAVTATLGHRRDALSNVTVFPTTVDMREHYARARVVLVPSLWWESCSRVVAEAMINAIPTLHTTRGGMAEVAGDGGIEISLPAECFAAPYRMVPTAKALKPLLDDIERVFDDDDFYARLCRRAREVGVTRHSLERNGETLSRTLSGMIRRA